MAEGIKTQYPNTCCLEDTPFRFKDTHRLKVKGYKKIFHANGNQKRAGVTILISDKIDFMSKNVTGDKGGHYIMIKQSNYQEKITILSIYTPNIGATKYVMQILTKLMVEIDSDNNSGRLQYLTFNNE